MMECEQQQQKMLLQLQSSLCLAQQALLTLQNKYQRHHKQLEKKNLFLDKVHIMQDLIEYTSLHREKQHNGYRAKSNQLNTQGILITENWAFLP